MRTGDVLFYLADQLGIVGTAMARDRKGAVQFSVPHVIRPASTCVLTARYCMHSSLCAHSNKTSWRKELIHSQCVILSRNMVPNVARFSQNQPLIDNKMISKALKIWHRSRQPIQGQISPTIFPLTLCLCSTAS
jgi:hypothetical protein